MTTLNDTSPQASSARLPRLADARSIAPPAGYRCVRATRILSTGDA